MSKKDKAQEQQQATMPVESPTVVTLADVLEGKEGVTVSDDRRLRVSAADKETLTARVEDVKHSIEGRYTVTVSPVYGNAEALGCVWNDIIATPKK